MLNSHQPGFAQRLLSERRHTNFSVVTLERDNSIKHAISKLRTSCLGSGLKGNHVKAGKVDAAQNVTASYLHVEPTLLLAEASEAAKGRLLMEQGIEQLGGVQYELHYEALQMDPAASLSQLMRSVGMADVSRVALRSSAMVKGVSDDLRDFVLNHAELHDAFGSQPCLQRMLTATSPTRFPRDCVNLTAASARRQAKQDSVARVLLCTGVGACELAGMNRLAQTAYVAQRKRCRRAVASQIPGSAEAAVCMPGCTPAELRLCAQAVASSQRDQGTSLAEVCTLRTPDDVVAN